MVDSRELMIGNWVMYKGVPYEVYTVYPNSVILNGELRLPKSISPIDLTPEILGKVEAFFYNANGGYSLIDENFYLYYLADGIYEVQICVSTNKGEFVSIAEIKHLHQLQNLVKLLTGVELEVKM